jgi:general secretion pathway protein D
MPAIRELRTLRLAVLLLCLAGCAAMDPVLEQSRSHIAAGRGEEALLLLQDSMRAHPENREYRAEFYRQRDFAVARWLAAAETFRAAGHAEAAGEMYRRVESFDPANTRASQGLSQLESDARHREIVAGAAKLVEEEKYLAAQDALRPVLLKDPQHREARRLQRQIEEKTAPAAYVAPRLKPANAQPISLEMREVPLRAVFDAISRSSGVSFALDKDVRADQKTTLVLRQAPVEKLIRLVLATNQLEQKLVDETTILVFPNTPQKLREYQELVVKGFYLSNADVKQTANMIRALVKTRDLFIDEKLNLLVIKDTPSAVRLAERLIAAQDLAEPEVMLEVEVLEVGANRLQELGMRFPETVAWSIVGAAGKPGVATLPEWLNRSSELVQLAFSDPLFLLTLRQQDGSTSVLANPRIRVKNKEKARVHIGDRVPVITTTAAATGGFVSESVSYLDVGLKLEVEPLVHLQDDVGIKVGLEVSNIAREVRSLTSNTLTYQIGTRNASTVLRLRDGETQVLAGLISDEDRRSASRVPGVGDLPTVGRLFSATRDSTTKTEIVLLITPRLKRTLARPGARSLEFAAGTEASTGVPGASTPATSQAAPAAPAGGAAPAPQKPAVGPVAPEMVPLGGVKPPAPAQ